MFTPLKPTGIQEKKVFFRGTLLMQLQRALACQCDFL